MFSRAFQVSGVVTQVEVATALALNTYGTEVALVMVLGFIMNLVFAKVTPFKAVFLTGQHFLYFACVLALVFIALGAPMFVTVILGGVILGLCGAALPSLCQPFVNKLTGTDNIALGHFNCIGYAFSGYVGKLFAKKNESETEKEEKQLPEFFKLFKDFVFSVALFMVVLFYIVTLACFFTGHFGDQLANGKAFTSYFGNDVWWMSGRSSLASSSPPACPSWSTASVSSSLRLPLPSSASPRSSSRMPSRPWTAPPSSRLLLTPSSSASSAPSSVALSPWL